MRRLLIAAAAAPLAFAAGSALAATTTISSSRTSAIATSTAASGSASDVDIASGGSISGTGTTPAVTLDSSNAVTIEGSITNDNNSGAVGVLINGGNTGSFTNTGTITITEDYTATDSKNSDGIVEAPFAEGSDRYGVRLIGSSPFVGNIINGGAISVKGNDSYGISLEAPLTGTLTNSGTLSLTGDSGVALQETAGVSGTVELSGAITATGQNSRGVSLAGDVGGAVEFRSSVTTTGYSYTTRPTTESSLKNVQNTATDVEQSGAAVTVSGSVADGIYLSGAPTGTVTGSTADLDGDGVADGSETTASIISYGSASALIIGGANKAITIGAYGTGDNAYGLVNRGTILGEGVYDGVTANALTIGASGGTVSITGGLRNVDEIESTSYEADSTAIHILSGATVPTIWNQGTIGAVIDDSALTTSTTATATATAIAIESGASVSKITNTGTIEALATGDAMSATAIVDKSGSVSTVINEGTIEAVVSATTAGDVLTGKTVALDLSANTTGVTLIQQTNPSPNITYGSTSGSTATTTVTETATTPSIVGDVYLGNGNNTVELLSGSLLGALSLGSGTDSLTINGGATLIGALTYGGSALTLDIENGELEDMSSSSKAVSTMTLGSSANLIVTADPANNTATAFNATGAVTIASGAKIGVRVSSVSDATQTYTIISSPSLTVNETASALLGSTPYLYSVSLATTADSVTATLARKSNSELGLNVSEAAALDPVLVASESDSSVEQALLSPTTKSAFTRIYDQLLPEHGGGAFLMVDQVNQAIGRATSNPNNMTTSGATGAWVQEFVVDVMQDKNQGAGSNSAGLGFAGGYERDTGGLGAFGVTAAFFTGDEKNPDIPGDTKLSLSELEGGVNWVGRVGGLQLDARAAGGYLWITDRRELEVAATDDAAAFSRSAKSTDHGYTLSGRFNASYQWDLGNYYVRPQAHVDYFRMNQDGYAERGGGDAFDLTVDGRTGYDASATASVNFGGRFGSGLVWRPNIEVGVRDIFAGDAGSTTARFSAGGDNFTLTPNDIQGVGGIARVGLKVTGDFYELSFDAGGEIQPNYKAADVRAMVRVLF